MLTFSDTCCVCVTTVAQNGVCGIPYGTTKKHAKEILIDRFGYNAVYDEGGSLNVFDGSVGGITHRFLKFEFVWIEGESKFNGADFSTPFALTEKNDAINFRDIIHNKYSTKYDSTSYTNNDGFKCYMYYDTDKIPVAVLELLTDKGKDGKRRHYVDIYHIGPYENSDDI